MTTKHYFAFDRTTANIEETSHFEMYKNRKSHKTR